MTKNIVRRAAMTTALIVGMIALTGGSAGATQRIAEPASAPHQASMKAPRVTAKTARIVRASAAHSKISAGQTELALFWNSARGDNATCGTFDCENDQFGSGYSFVRVEGHAFDRPVAGAVPLRLYWNRDRLDNATCATAACVGDQIGSGYTFVRIEGWVYPTQLPGTVALWLFWNNSRGDNVLCGTAACVNDQINSGYTFVRIEGWVLP